MKDPTIVRTFSDRGEAEIARSMLEAEGIEAGAGRRRCRGERPVVRPVGGTSARGRRGRRRSRARPARRGDQRRGARRRGARDRRDLKGTLPFSLQKLHGTRRAVVRALAPDRSLSGRSHPSLESRKRRSLAAHTSRTCRFVSSERAVVVDDEVRGGDLLRERRLRGDARPRLRLRQAPRRTARAICVASLHVTTTSASRSRWMPLSTRSAASTRSPRAPATVPASLRRDPPGDLFADLGMDDRVEVGARAAGRRTRSPPAPCDR